MACAGVSRCVSGVCSWCATVHSCLKARVAGLLGTGRCGRVCLFQTQPLVPPCQQWVMIVVHRGLLLADHLHGCLHGPHTRISESRRFFRWNRIVLWFGLLCVDTVWFLRHFAIGDGHVFRSFICQVASLSDHLMHSDNIVHVNRTHLLCYTCKGQCLKNVQTCISTRTALMQS